MTRMYEQNGQCSSAYPCDYPLLRQNVMAVWPAGKFAFVNWAGHGSPTSTHIYGLGAPSFIRASDCSSLNDDYPAIIFADACSNSDTDHLNIGQAMLQRGGVGFLGATKVAYGRPGWNDPMDGSSQSMDYFFTTYVTSGDYTQGQAHQLALTDMYTYGLWSSVKYEMFEWGSLWGNPNLG
ncbi:MAG: C25 family cysteine peptidase, partial [Planctomycetota bacterium]